MERVDQGKANTVRQLAQRFTPDWQIPEACVWFALPDRDLASLFNADLVALRSLRGIWQDRLEAVESGVGYYQRGVGTESYYNARGMGNKITRFTTDRASAYAMLWHIDAMILVHTAPIGYMEEPR